MREVGLLSREVGDRLLHKRDRPLRPRLPRRVVCVEPFDDGKHAGFFDQGRLFRGRDDVIVGADEVRRRAVAVACVFDGCGEGSAWIA